jgi:transketolase
MSREPAAALRERIENTIRGLTIDAVGAASSGHVGAPLGLARPVFELWDRHLRFDPRDPDWPLRDRFVLSAGHASMLLYSLLHLFGFDIPLEEIRRFRQLGSRTPGHPEYGETPGVEVTTGPLGQGFGHAVGMALAARMARSRYGRGGEGPGHHRVYVVASDGDLMEGVSHEAASIAGHLGLGNLVVLYDDNRVTIDGPTELSFSENVPGRFDAYGWHVLEADGEDVASVRDALEAAKAEEGRPSILCLRTVIGYGSPNRAGTGAAHGAAISEEEEARLTKENLGWPLEPTFLVPEDVRGYLAQSIAAKRADREAEDARLDRWRASHPDLARAWETARGREVAQGFEGRLLEGLAEKSKATRQYSGEALARLCEEVPYLVGGSADLAGSNNTTLPAGAFIGPGAGEGVDPFAGSNFHFGVREHAMGTIANGIALDGTFLPYAGTFLVFSDYMRPTIRLAALMGVRSTFVFTHDTIFTDEDGPTHQPVEQLDALRAIPGLTVFRPADSLETTMAWAWVASQASGPVLFALSRQKVATFKREASFDPRSVWKGAYAVREPESPPDVVLVATGSEVPLACEAADRLREEGAMARVVSCPSLELFLAQPEDYQRALVPDDGPPVAVVEALRAESFRRLVGRRGFVYGVDRFGASAPSGVLAEAYGFTAERLAARVLAHLGR